jgi:hypothetical protein
MLIRTANRLWLTTQFKLQQKYYIYNNFLYYSLCLFHKLFFICFALFNFVKSANYNELTANMNYK